jgi:hypothetical protein
MGRVDRGGSRVLPGITRQRRRFPAVAPICPSYVPNHRNGNDMNSIDTSAGRAGAMAGRPGQQPPAPRGGDPMKAVAEKLNLTTDELRTRLDSGKSLADVADARGVSRDDLVATVRAGLPTSSSSTAEQIATNRERPQVPPPGPPPGGPKGELSGLSTDDGKVDRISSLLGTDAEEVRKVDSAAELVKMFQDRGIDLNALRSVLNSGDLLDVAA